MTEQEYEAVKAQVLEEQRAERRARVAERERIRKAAYGMFEETEKEYLPRLVMKFGKQTGNYDCAYGCQREIYGIKRTALKIVGERNEVTAYEHGRVEEANAVLKQLLDELLAD